MICMWVYHNLFFATRIKINVSWSGAGFGQMKQIQPALDLEHCLGSMSIENQFLIKENFHNCWFDPLQLQKYAMLQPKKRAYINTNMHFDLRFSKLVGTETYHTYIILYNDTCIIIQYNSLA